jgi:hypothetical protein
MGREGAWIDLSEDTSAYLALLADTHAWRERLVNELRFGSLNRVRSISSFQIDFPPELIEKLFGVERPAKGNLLLPLTTREKRPLLNLSVAGPRGCPATVVVRKLTAHLQAEHIASWARQSDAGRDLERLLERRLCKAIGAFSPSYFISNFACPRGEDPASGIAEYLTSGLGFKVAEDEVRRWRDATQATAETLVRCLQEPPERFSSSEEVLLAIPNMEPLPSSTNEIGEVVERFCRGVDLADRNRDEDLLMTIAEYGRRYELIVEVEVPLLEPSRVKVEEDLPLVVERRRAQYWVEHLFPVGDARSAHFEARVEDPNVEIVGNELRDLHDEDPSGWMEAVRMTREALAVYTSEPDRPYYAKVAIRFRVAGHSLAAAYALSLANVLALLFVLLLEPSGEEASRLAVLAIPTTVAATFVLVREQTALAVRLQVIPRCVLAATALALWAVVSIVVLTAGGSGETLWAKKHPTSSSYSRKADMPRVSEENRWRKTEQEETAVSGR